MSMANERAAAQADHVRKLSARWEAVCQQLGATTERIMADEFEVQRDADRFVVNWVSSGRPCVRSVGADGRAVALPGPDPACWELVEEQRIDPREAT